MPWNQKFGNWKNPSMPVSESRRVNIVNSKRWPNRMAQFQSIGLNQTSFSSFLMGQVCRCKVLGFDSRSQISAGCTLLTVRCTAVLALTSSRLGSAPNKHRTCGQRPSKKSCSSRCFNLIHWDKIGITWDNQNCKLLWFTFKTTEGHGL